MTRMTRAVQLAGAAAIVVVGVACSDRAEDRTEAAARDAAKVAEAAGRSVGDAVANAGRAADAAVETMDVKAALMGDSRVDASGINVDTNHETKTVTLKGHVPTATQKTMAEQIAIERAVGYRVRNELTVEAAN